MYEYIATTGQSKNRWSHLAVFCVTFAITLGSIVSLQHSRNFTAQLHTGISISGRVYTDRGSTAIGDNKTVALSINGASASATDETDSNGDYTLPSLSIETGDTVTLFLEDETEDGVTVSLLGDTLLAGSTVTGFDIYQDHLIVRSDSGSVALTNTNLITAAGLSDDDLSNIFTLSSNNLTLPSEKSLFVWDTYNPDADVTVGSGVVLSGAIVSKGNTISLAGSLDTLSPNGSFSSTGTFVFTATNPVHILSRTNAFSGVTLNGAGGTFVVSDTLDINGNFLLTAGTLEQRTNTIDIAENMLIASGFTFTKSTNSSALIFDGSSILEDDSAVDLGVIQAGDGSSTLTFSGNIIASSFTIPSTNTVLTDGYNLTVSGSFVNAGTYNATDGVRATMLLVEGDFNNTGTFTSGTSSVVLNGTSQTIAGSTSFYNLTKTVSTADTLQFTAGTTQTITNTLTLSGVTSNLLSLRSTTDGSIWSIDAQGTRNLKFLDVKDSTNTNSTVMACVTGCENSDNNTNWQFTNNVNISGTVYTDKGVTAIASGKKVSVSVDGEAATLSGITNSSGKYTIKDVSLSGGSVISLFLDGETEKALTLTTVGSEDVTAHTLTGVHLYKDTFILRADSGSTILRSSHIELADNSADSDITAFYATFSSTGTVIHSGKELYVWSDDTVKFGGDVFASTVDIRGTLNMSQHNLTITGSLVATGTLSSTGTVFLTGTSSHVLSLPQGSIQDLEINNGLNVYATFDYLPHTGYAVSGVTLSSSSSGRSVVLPSAIQFYNPHSLLVNSGSSIRITATATNDGSETLDIGTRNFTLAGWVQPTIQDEDAFIIGKAGALSGEEGFALSIPSSSKKLQLSVHDGTNAITVLSDTTVSTGAWVHVAAVWDNANDTTSLYYNGTATGTVTGTVSSVGDVNNAKVFTIAQDADEENHFEGYIDDMRYYSRALSSNEIAALAAGNRTTGSGTYTLTGALHVGGSLRIGATDIDVSTSDYGITVGEDFVNYGAFNSQSGSVTLSASGEAFILGDTEFYNLAMTGASVTLKLDAFSRQTLSGALNIGGTSIANMNITGLGSSSTPSYFRANTGSTVSGTNLTYLTVSNINSASGNTLVCTTGCLDNGGNTNWDFCGNAQTDTDLGEACDDGNRTDGDGCSADCSTIEEGYTCTGSVCTAFCGDGLIVGGETCDNGNDNSDTLPNACRKTCVLAYCGDSVVDNGEVCDDGNNSTRDSCINCKLAFCGDNFVREGVEECDPPNLEEGGRCNNACQIDGKEDPEPSQTTAAHVNESEFCGNGIHEEAFGEECDKGNNNGRSSCSTSCKKLYCGDGVVSLVIGEECEPKTKTVSGVTLFDEPECGDICTVPVDRDGELHGGCRQRVVPCNDELDVHPSAAEEVIEESNEEASEDLGSESEESAQQPQQDVRTCGDGSINQAFEECDDGNTSNGDGCSSQCTVEKAPVAAAPEQKAQIEQVAAVSFCGDGVRDENEECDDGNRNSDVLQNRCRSNCTAPRCGDFVKDNGEECDLGAGNSQTAPNTCRLNCLLPRCGDGVTDAGEDCDGSIGCLRECLFAMHSASVEDIEELVVDEVAEVPTSVSDEVAEEAIEDSNEEEVEVAGVFEESIPDSQIQEEPFAPFVPSVPYPQQPIYQPAYASIIPITPHSTPVGDTGPAAVIFIVSGAASGFAYMRRKKS